MNPYRIGDKVEVTAPGKTFSTHEEAFFQFGFRNKERNNCFEIGTKATVFNTGIVNSFDETVSIRDENGNESLIGIDGVKLINQQTMPTKEQILEAAATSHEAKQALEKLFPEYFNYVSFDNVYSKQYPYALAIRIDNHDLLVAYKDCQKFPGILLSDFYNWEIVEGKYLIPTKK